MNCKPGDVARIIVPGPFEGRILVCIEISHTHSDGDSAWVVDPPPPGFRYVWDSALRPIRDQPGDDETLTWAPVPSEVTA
jgi:hypothetical protein